MKISARQLLITALLLFVLSASTVAAPAELWAIDPVTGTKVCVIFQNDNQTLVSVSWLGAAVGGLAEGQGQLQFVYRDKASKEIKARADGGMKASKLHGQVSIRWSDGDSYDGNYQDGWRDGGGVYRFASGTVYEGEWKNGICEGKGLMKYANGNIYDGEFKNGVPDGKGTIKWKAGMEYAVYEGDVRNNMPEGQGTYRWPDGRSYQGSFINGAFGACCVTRTAKWNTMTNG